MLFYTYTAPGMFPGRLAGIVTGIRGLESGGDSVRLTDDNGYRWSTYYSDVPAYRTTVLVCPD